MRSGRRTSNRGRIGNRSSMRRDRFRSMIWALRKALLPAAMVAFAWATIASITGGIDTRVLGVLIPARGALRPILAGSALLLAYALLHPDEFGRGRNRLARAVRVSAPILGL